MKLFISLVKFRAPRLSSSSVSIDFKVVVVSDCGDGFVAAATFPEPVRVDRHSFTYSPALPGPLTASKLL